MALLLLAAFLFAPIPPDSTESLVQAGPTVQADPTVQLVFHETGSRVDPDLAFESSVTPTCGWVLDSDFAMGLASFRRPDNLSAWTMVKCTVPPYFVIAEFQWTTSDATGYSWGGLADWAVWDVDVVERGCADDSNPILSRVDVPNFRTDNPFECCICDWHPCFHYTMPVDIRLPAGEYYFGVRNYCDDGWSQILSRDCAGDSPIYFQSVFFGFPCAVPGREIFENDYCAQVMTVGETRIPCERIRRLKVRCANGRIKAVVRTDLIEGTPLLLTNDGADPVRVWINPDGKARARWTHQTGIHRICVAECGRCRRTDCGG